MESFVETADGVVIIANGIDPVLRWDGYAMAASIAGVTPPTDADIPTLAGFGVGAISGSYQAYVRFVDNNGNFSNLSPASALTSIAGALAVQYGNLAVSSQPSVVRRQILRNTNGQLTTFYVDIDTTDLGSTILISGRDDANLRAQTAVPLFDSSGNDIVNVYTPPPDYKPFIAWHQNRMYYAGVQPYNEGSVRVDAGSAVVRGAMTEWPASLAGRLIYIDGADKPYEIDSVDVAQQFIFLTQAYQGGSFLGTRYAAYSVKPAAAEDVTFYFSEANNAEAVPATNAFTLPQDGDDVTGIMNYDSFLYFLKRRRMYRLTTRINPIADGQVYLGINRGCVNNRCWVVANEVAYMLDEGGVYAFSGDKNGQPASATVQDLFRRDGFTSLQINWPASRYFHASHSPQEETIRWFVCIGGDTRPRHALAYGYTTQRWWIEEFQHPIGANSLGRVAGIIGATSSGSEQVYYGSFANKVYATSANGIDGCKTTGAARRKIVSSTPWTATLSGTDLTPVVGASIAIVRGRARGQTRRISEYAGTVVRVDRPWDVLPDRDDVVQVGGVPIEWRTHRVRYMRDEKRGSRVVEFNYFPVPAIDPKQSVAVSFYDDYSTAAKVIGRRLDGGLSQGVLAAKGANETEVFIDGAGYQNITCDGGAEGQTNTPNAVVIGLSGVSGPARVRINSLLVGGLSR